MRLKTTSEAPNTRHQKIKTIAFIVALICAFVSPVLGQAIRVDSQSYTTNASCVSGRQCPVLAVPGSTIQVCTPPGCSAPATTYTDASAGSACPALSPVTITGGANPTTCVATSDAQGNFGFWLLPGSYTYYVTVPSGTRYGPYPVSVHGDAGGYTLDSLYTTLALACSAAGNGTLAITKVWTGTPTQALACSLAFFGNGQIQPAAGATVTITGGIIAAVRQKIFDTSLSGAVIAYGGSGISNPAYATWWGADPAGVSDSAPALNACIAVGNRCDAPEGAYKTLSAVKVIKHSFTLNCLSRTTSITYAGGTIDYPFVIGDGTLAFQNGDTVNNCQFYGSASVTGATVHVHSDNIYLDKAGIFGGPVGLFVDASVFGTYLNLNVGANGGNIPTTGMKIRNSNQHALISPVIQQMSKTTTTALDIDTSAGISVTGGSFETLAYGIVTGTRATAVSVNNLDMEDVGIEGIVAGGTGFSVIGESYLATVIHLLSTSYSFTIDGTDAEWVELDAGATKTYIANSGFAPVDAIPQPAGLSYIIDHGGIETVLENNYLNNGAPDITNRTRLPDYGKGNFVSSFRGQSFGCLNCIQDIGGSTGVVKGTYGFIRMTMPPVPVWDGLEVNVYLAHGLQVGLSNTFEFTNAAVGGVAMGVKNIRDQFNPGLGVGTAYPTGTFVRLKYSAAGDCWFMLYNRPLLPPVGLQTFEANEVGGSADHALVVTAVDSLGNSIATPIDQGTQIMVRLTHDLQAGANTINVNGIGALPIVKDIDTGNLTAPWSHSGQYLFLKKYGNISWLMMTATSP